MSALRHHTQSTRKKLPQMWLVSSILIARHGVVAEAVRLIEKPESSAELVLAWARANGR
jgi:hypothetical protein